jgi:molybdate transport repressor ModE-like protein
VDWDNLRYLLAVARAGSVAEAAKQLGVSHSTVYRRVNAFEQDHGVELFERLPDGYRLTEAGEALVAKAAKIADAVDDVARSLETTDEIAGQVIIAAPEAVGLAIAPRLGGLIERYPSLTMSWRLDSSAVNLHRREADIAIRVTREPPETLVGRRLADVEFAIYGARQYLDRRAWSDAGNARWVVFDGPLAQSPQGRWESEHVGEACVALRVDRRVMLDEAVRAGIGVGILPRAVGDTAPRLELLDAVGELTSPLWVLTHPDLRAVPRVRAVLDFIFEALSPQNG